MSRTRLVVEINGSQISVSGTVDPEDLGVLQKLLQDQGRSVAVHLGNAPANRGTPGPSQYGADDAPAAPSIESGEGKDVGER